MIGTAVWWVLIGASVALELLARARAHVVAPLSRLGARLAVVLPLRAVLWAGWIFVGVHLFARYTSPPH
ncbi:MAG: hypothetical protein ACRDVC_06925 [Acidimicrobiales bacterium]